MFKIKSILSFPLLMLYLSGYSQYLVNTGSMNISGGYVNITGSYQNQSSGNITLNGTISLSGDWVNNASNQVLNSPGSNSGNVIFAGTSQNITGTSTTTFLFEQLTINSGAMVNIAAAKAVTAYGNTQLNGHLALLNDGASWPTSASFIDNGTITGSGVLDANYHLEGAGSPGVPTGRYWLLSAPVSPVTFAKFNVPSTNTGWFWNESGNAYDAAITDGSTPIPMGKGFLFRGYTTEDLTVSGTPVTGTYSNIVSFPTTSYTSSTPHKGYYLFGNPYPSSLDWNKVTRTNMLQTIIYYSFANASSSTYIYEYWNGITATLNGGVAVDSCIPPLQCVWVRCSSVNSLTASLSVNNTMRLHNVNNSGSILKSIDSSYDIFRLNLTGNGYKDQQVIIQTDIASDGYDPYDAEKMFLNNDSIAEMYTFLPDQRLVMQAVKPITVQKSFPLGLNVGIAGSYKFVADFSQSLMQTDVYLQDNANKVYQKLTDDPEFDFTSKIVADTIGSRFILTFLPRGETFTPTYTTPVNTYIIDNLEIYSYKNDIFVKNSLAGSNVYVYNIDGKLVLTDKLESENQTIHTNLNNGCYVVRITNANYTKSKKLVLMND